MFIRSGLRLLVLKRDLLKKSADIVSKKEGISYLNARWHIIYDSFRYGTTYPEYVSFDFYNRKKDNKNTFITTLWLLEVIKKYNPEEYRDMFHDKIKFNTAFSEYLGREFLVVEGTDDNEIRKFLTRHTKVVLKGSKGASGNEIKVMDSSAPDIMIEIKSGKFGLIEEYIVNHDDIKKLNPTSLNTVRIVTVHSGKAFHVVFAGLRIGARGAVVDNVSQGGASAIINIETGKINSVFVGKATCETSGTQSNRNETGFQMPYWNETIEMIKKASGVVPRIRIVGWDVAITPKGPVLVEGNESFGPSVMQYYAGLNDSGLKNKMIEAIKNT